MVKKTIKIDHKVGYVFDLDGTLVDSLIDIHQSMNIALESIGCDPLSQAIIQTLIGPDLEKALSRQVTQPDFSFDRFIKKYVHHYTQHCTDNTTVYPGVEKVLRQLTKSNKHCFVLTNKPEKQAIRILKKLSLFPFMSCIIGIDTYNKAKPNPIGLIELQKKYHLKQEEMIMIGDTSTDIKTAHSASITAVAVTYGYGKKESVKKEMPHYTINHIEALVS